MPQEPVTIAIETSSRIGSVALGIQGNLLAEITFSEPLRHSSELLPSILALLDQHHFTARQIKQVFISIGPGSFTGLRIAVATAKAMALAKQERYAEAAERFQEALDHGADSPALRLGYAAALYRNPFTSKMKALVGIPIREVQSAPARGAVLVVD